MENLYRAHVHQRTKPDLDQVQLVIQRTINELEKVYILVDGLDEVADVVRRENFLEVIKALLADSNVEGGKLHVLITSRQPNHLLGGDSIEIRPALEEIRSMVERRINTSRSFRHSIRDGVLNNPEIRSEILGKVASEANGIFLIADLHLKSLSHLTNLRDLRKALDKLPESLNDYYESAWVRISCQEEPLRTIAHHTISWLHFARRQLQIEELRHALAIRAGDTNLSTDSLTNVIDILETCQGLVILEPHGKVVRLMHSTVQDFIKLEHEQDFEQAPYYLASTCLSYLCLEVFQTRCDYISELDANMRAQPGENIAFGKIMSNLLIRYPFFNYAAENWGYHAQGYAEVQCLESILDLFILKHPLENAHMVHSQIFPSSKRLYVVYSWNLLDPLRVAVSYGLEHTTIILINTISVSTEALQDTAMKNHLLLVLLEALENGLLNVAKALLDAGIDPSPDAELPLTALDRTFTHKYECPKTALDKSVFYGHGEAAALLLKRKIGGRITARTIKYAVAVGDQNILSHYLSTAKNRKKRVRRATVILHLASKHGNLEFAKFSLDKGALIDLEDTEGLNALAKAVVFGQCDVVGLLLDAGSDTAFEIPDWTGMDKMPQSLLQAAVTSRQVFKTRIDLVRGFGLCYSSTDFYDSSVAQLKKQLSGWLTMDPRPLKLLDNPDFMTAKCEDLAHQKLIGMLLDRGADPTIQGDAGATLLHLAAFSEPRLNALLQYSKSHPDLGMDVNARDENGRTPLHYAASACNSAVIERLIENGADVAATDNLVVTTLHYAVLSPECIQVAQKYGCRVDKTHAILGNPLQFARSRTQPNLHAIEVLEDSLKVLVSQGSLEGQPVHSYQQVPDTESEVFLRIEVWMMLNECKVVSRSYMERELGGSQQQGHYKILAFKSAQAEGKQREWNLIPDT
ncbi:MAG: hypothetical protein Q9204_004975 [Flavoplaca sp. TL-2023a]